MNRRLWGSLGLVALLLTALWLSTSEPPAKHLPEAHPATGATGETSPEAAMPETDATAATGETGATGETWRTTETHGTPATGETAATSATPAKPGAPPGPPAPSSTNAQRPQERRDHARWNRPGQCSANGPVLQARAAFLQGFRRDRASEVEALVHPAVPVDAFWAVASLLRQVTDDTARLAQLPISTPPLVLYASVDDLLRHACVHPAAVAYYDGALHVSADTDIDTLRANLQHEIVHHALMIRGVASPLWLHEGLAMFNAREIWWADPHHGLLSWGLRYHHAFDRMVASLPRAQSEAAALAVYFQSIMMVQTVMDAGGGYDRIWRLVEALARGDLAPSEAFAWGVQTHDPAQQEALWHQTVRAITQAAVGPGYAVD